MSQEKTQTIMSRKAGAGRPPPEVTLMSPAKALRLAFSRGGEAEGGHELSVTKVVESRTTMQKMADDLPENGLIVLMEGPNGAGGLVVYDPQLVAGLIEHLTMGSVLHKEAPDRKPTATDAIMCSDLIDRVMDIFEDLIQDAADPPPVEGYRYDVQLPDLRAVALAMEDQPYRKFDVTIDIGRGAKSGEAYLILPWARAKTKVPGGANMDFTAALRANVLGTTAEMDSVLHRTEIAIEKVLEFKTGTQIPIPRSALSKVMIEGLDGRCLARARLGQANGFRALRVSHLVGQGDDDADDVMEEDLDMMHAGAGGFGGMGMGSGLGSGMSDIGGDLPSLAPMGDFPPMGDLPPLGDFPPMGDLPPLGNMADLDDNDSLAPLPMAMGDFDDS